jgi:small-conductance mechanosensitive channel
MLEDPFQLLVPLALLAATVVAGLVIRALLFRIVSQWAARTESKLDLLLAESLRGPVILWSIILGLHLATQNSEIPRIYLRYVPRTLAVLWIASLTMAMSRLAGSAVHFYGSRVAGARSVTSLTQKLVQLAVVAVGLGVLLRVFDVSLTPILTTLGVGGLAVALALQDTLSNLFAGFYVSISGLVHIGDYIKLNTGEEGYVADINWRCTTMKGSSNNLVVVPNSKLGQAIYTNYNLPENRMLLSLPFSVAIDADIDRAQQILQHETIAAADDVEGLLSDPPPYVLFNPGPRDAALVFNVFFSIGEFGKQDLVQSELRKRIFKRLRAEGIAAPLPPRTILYEQKNPA